MIRYKEFLQEGLDELTEHREAIANFVASGAVLLFILLIIGTFIAIATSSAMPFVVVLSIFFGAIFVVSAGCFIYLSVFWLINRKDM